MSQKLVLLSADGAAAISSALSLDVGWTWGVPCVHVELREFTKPMGHDSAACVNRARFHELFLLLRIYFDAAGSRKGPLSAMKRSPSSRGWGCWRAAKGVANRQREDGQRKGERHRSKEGGKRGKRGEAQRRACSCCTYMRVRGLQIIIIKVRLSRARLCSLVPPTSRLCPADARVASLFAFVARARART